MHTRRDVLLAALAVPAAFAKDRTTFEISVEGYIFQQYAERQKKPLADVIPEVLPMVRAAGFRNVELSPAFFAPEFRSHTVSLLHSLDLRMPSIYVGGAMHTREDAERTTQTALE